VRNPFYEYSPIVHRPPFELPGGSRLALWFGVAIEHYPWGKPGLSLVPYTADLVPDPMNYGWRDYGPRVGAFRLMDILDRAGVPVTGIVNSDACTEYPGLIEEALKRGWTSWVAHGDNNSTWQVGLERDAEVELVKKVTSTIEAAVGHPPAGWIGPALTGTMNTFDVIAEAGYRYTIDWADDDQPHWVNVTSGSLASVPYQRELNDVVAFMLHHETGAEFAQSILDAVDQMLADPGDHGRVLGVGFHPFLVGQPWRAIHLARALEQLRDRDGVWLTTSDAVADLFYESSAAATDAEGASPQ
jgi:peptidoglycan/xylan/chitin deacetylase (PgdA/CDA1 family)